MRFFLFLILVSLAAPALAQSKGNLDFLQPKRAAPTKEQIDESLQVLKSCQSSELDMREYDCHCVAAFFLDMRSRGNQENLDTVTEAAERKCVNQPEIAGFQYKRCLTWAPQQRDDYERYCRCYANGYTENFSRNPVQSISTRDRLMSDMMAKCETGDVLDENQSRSAVIDWLKQTGVYKALFPGVNQQP